MTEPPGITGRVNFVILVALTVPITVSYWRMRRSRSKAAPG